MTVANMLEQLENANLTHEQLVGMITHSPFMQFLVDEQFRISYLNPKGIEFLSGLAPEYRIEASEMVGSSVYRLVSRLPKLDNLISSKTTGSVKDKLGDKTLELHMSPLKNAEGVSLGSLHTWIETSAAEEKLPGGLTGVLFHNMMSNIPINVIFANREFEITYINPQSIKQLRQIEHLLPVKVDQILGNKIDIFHKNPEMQRRMLSDPKNLPHRAKIQLGKETLDLLVSAIYDKDGNYQGPMVTWNVVTDRVIMADDFEKSIKAVVDNVKSSSVTMKGSSENMAASAEETSRQAQVVAASSEEATRNVQTVSSAAEELSASISEIARHVQDASEMTSTAVSEAQSTNQTIKALGEASQEIGQVIKVITSIAQQTNLLALNATIEAARAGEAGKGFAVVANEVKELARQTGRATEEISLKISAIQSSTNVAVKAIESISGTIGRINEISTTIAGAVEEQSAATSEISRNVSEAAMGTAEVTNNITSVSKAAEVSGSDANEILKASVTLTEMATQLDVLSSEFLKRMRAF